MVWIIWYSKHHYLWYICAYIMLWIIFLNGCVSLSASSDQNWNLLESEDAGMALVRSIEKTGVCDLSASRECDGVTLLHLAAARGYNKMLRHLLELQVKLEGNLILLSPALLEPHASWYDEGPFEGPLKPFGTILFLYLTGPLATIMCFIICLRCRYLSDESINIFKHCKF